MEIKVCFIWLGM